MDFDELLISTGVDALIKLVKEKKEIELAEAAEILKISPPTIKEWAQMLEDEGLISVKYKLAKSYLRWIEPTEDEIEEKKILFVEKKKSVSQDISSLQGKLDDEKQSLNDLKSAFTQLYNKLYPKLKELDERTKNFDVAKEKSVKQIPVNEDKLMEISSKLEDLDSMLVFTQSQLNKTKTDILEHGVTVDEVSSLKAIKDEISEMNNRLNELEEKSYETMKTLPKETSKYGDFPKELEEIKKHFIEVVSESRKAREFFKNSEKNIKEFKSLKKKLSTKGAGIPALKLEFSKLSKSMEEMEEKFSMLSGKIIDSKKVVDALSSPKGSFEGVPEAGAVTEKLKNLEENERLLGEKIKQLEKSSKSLSKVSDLVKSFEKIRKEIDKKKEKLTVTAEDVFKRMDEEDETYKVFQKIKEKAVTSIGEYGSQLSSIKSELDAIQKQTKDIGTELKTGIRDALKSTSSGEVDSLVSKLEAIKGKKEAFEEINSSINELENKMDNVNKRVTLLSKQADLIKLRSGSKGVTAEETKEEEEGLRNEVELSKSEQEEFQRKRQELMHMIKKLWEEG